MVTCNHSPIPPPLEATMLLPNHTPGAPTLTSLPPECLLSIVAHLPPTSYGPLVQTSHYFLQFFSSHAATICNTYILTHYRASAFDLHSKYTNGWLIPSHPAVGAQERLLPPAHHTFTRPFGGALLLSEPGPQYLQFLTKYDFEIRTRREMADREHENADNSGDENEKVIEGVIDNEGDEVFEKMSKGKSIEEAFTYTIGTYAVRPFLRKMDDFARQLEEKRFVEGRRRLDERLNKMGGRGLGERLGNVVDKARVKVRELRKGLEGKVKALCQKLTRRKRELCFGEIVSSEESEIGRIDGWSERNVGVVRRDAMEDELLWYYGNAGVLAFRAREDMKQILGDEQIEDKMKEISTEKSEPEENATKRLKLRMKKVLRKALKYAACFGDMRHFESLD